MRRFNAVYLLILIICSTSAAEDARDNILHIYLPRSVKADGNTLTLDVLAAVRGQEQATQRAKQISMGRAPWSGERIKITRATILSRLASKGFSAGSVRLSGAEQVIVTRDEDKIPAEKLISCAREFLQKSRPGPTGCSWRLAQKPAEMLVPSGVTVSLEAQLPDKKTGDYVRVRITARGRERKLGQTLLLFKTVYPVRRAVAKEDIPAGEMVTPQNTKTKFFYVENKMSADYDLPFGMLARRSISTGTVIRRAMVRARKQSVIIDRNQTVTMKISGAGFVVTAIGRALEDGRTDELIKVRNIDTGKVIRARVLSDGRVEPVVTKTAVTSQRHELSRTDSEEIGQMSMNKEKK